VSIFAQLETHHCPLPKWMAGGIRAVNITKRGDRYILLLLGSQVIQKRAISIQSLFSASKTKTFASISIPPDLTSRSRVRVVGLLLLSLPRRDFFLLLLLPGSRKSLRIMDFGKCFRSVTHEGKVPGSIRTSRFHRTPFIDALCVSFSGVGKKKKKKKK
jgi:hypothetical protein